MKFSPIVSGDRPECSGISGNQASVTFLGFELCWFPDRKGTPRVTRRTARKKLQGACRRIKQWIRLNRHLSGRLFMAGLNRRLQGHYNYYGLIGNSRALWRFCQWAIECAFKWLNRRGGKRARFIWAAFNRVLKLLDVAKPGSISGGSRMRENRTSGSVQGAPGNRRFYRESSHPRSDPLAK